MEKALCCTYADKGGVCINGINFPNSDDGLKKVVLTDEMEKTYNRPWIDLRTTNIQVWESDCTAKEVFTFTQEDIGDWMVEIESSNILNTIYLIKKKG